MKPTWRKTYLWAHKWLPPKIEFIPSTPPDPRLHDFLKLLAARTKSAEIHFASPQPGRGVVGITTKTRI